MCLKSEGTLIVLVDDPPANCRCVEEEDNGEDERLPLDDERRPDADICG